MPVDGRPVCVVRVTVRRMRCPVLGCPRQTFREQVPGVLERYQRRTPRLTGQARRGGQGVSGPGGSPAAAARWAAPLSRTPPCASCSGLPCPLSDAAGAGRRRLRPAPQPQLRHRAHRRRDRRARSTSCPTARPTWSRRGCASIPASRSSAATAPPPTPRRSAGPCPTRCRSATAGTCGTTCAQGRWPRSAPTAACWATAVNPARPGGRARADHPRTLAAGPRPARQGRRPARMRPPPGPVPEHRQALRPRCTKPERLQRAPQYRPTLVDPYRDHLRRRRAEDPAVPVRHLLRRDQGTRLHRQRQPARPLPHPGPRRRRPAAPLTPPRSPGSCSPAPTTCATRTPSSLRDLTAACPEMTDLAGLIGDFAALLTPAPGNDA